MFDISEMYVTKICCSVAVEWKKGNSGNTKDRPYSGLSIVREGAIVYKFDDKEIISDTSCIVFLPQSSQYTWECTDDAQVIMINFLTENIPFLPPVSFKVSNANMLASLSQKAVDLYRKIEICGTASVLAVLYRIFSELRATNTFDEPNISKAIAYINENYMSVSLSVRDIAMHIGYSEVYLRHLFSLYCSMSPKQYIDKVRIDTASHMLAESSMSVTDISESCGFSSLYSFCRSFRKKTGYTPLEFRHINMPIL